MKVVTAIAKAMKAEGVEILFAYPVNPLIEAAAEDGAPGRHLRMPSAAGHDAAILSERMPAGMMFIPSLGGISHHWAEDTKEDDIVLGARIFADAAARILRSAG